LIQANHAFAPILMTTIAMVFGMFPIALAAGAGAEWKTVGMGNNWWFDKFAIPYADYCSIYEIMEKLIYKFTKERKQILMRLWSLTMNLKY
jgi:HAE1 family hydrophobic/amphiphilic exporter-1